MPEKSKTRPLSASRQRRQRNRRSSLNADPTAYNTHTSIGGKAIILSGVDLRTTKQKIEDLEQEMPEATSEEYLNHLVLMQLYTSLEYGDASIENARAYINLSKYYLNQKMKFLFQAKLHVLNARKILEQLNINPNDDNLKENIIGYDVYFLLLKCSLNAKQYLFQREIKIKNKHIISIEVNHIDHDLITIEKYLKKFKHLMDTADYDRIFIGYLFIKFEAIINDLNEFDKSIYELIDQIVDYIEKYYSNDQIKRIIDLYLRCGLYFINYDEKIRDGLNYYKKAVELAEEQERIKPSNEQKYQLVNAIFQQSKAKIRADRLTDDIEKELQRAIKLYKQPNDEMNKNVLKVIDELATFYTKVQKYQDALNILCESLPDKIRLFGDFSEEVIQTESRIGAIYLREGECLNAAEHLKACLDLQEFVYGPNDSRTCQTRNSVEILKKDPMVSRTFFARTQDGIRQDRPAFRLTNKVSHEKDDLQLLQVVTKKPPISSRT